MHRAVLVLCVAFSAASCGRPAPKPVPKPVPAPTPVVQAPKPPAPKPAEPPPKPTAAQMQQIEADFAKAEAIVKEADVLLAQAQAVLKDKGAEDANDSFVKAKKKYIEALGHTERWVDSDHPDSTLKQPQIDYYLRSYTDRLARWTKSMRLIPKLHD